MLFICVVVIDPKQHLGNAALYAAQLPVPAKVSRIQQHKSWSIPDSNSGGPNSTGGQGQHARAHTAHMLTAHVFATANASTDICP